MPTIELLINKYKRLQHRRNIASVRGQHDICEVYSKYMGRVIKKVKPLPEREKNIFYKSITELEYIAIPLQGKGMRWMSGSKINNHV